METYGWFKKMKNEIKDMKEFKNAKEEHVRYKAGEIAVDLLKLYLKEVVNMDHSKTKEFTNDLVIFINKYFGELPESTNEYLTRKIKERNNANI